MSLGLPEKPQGPCLRVGHILEPKIQQEFNVSGTSKLFEKRAC